MQSTVLTPGLDLSLPSTMSVPLWEPGVQYNYGDIVEFRIRYKINQPHRSQHSWVPTMMPALWSRIPDNEWDNHKPYSPPHEPYNPPHETGNYNSQDVHQPDDCSWHPGQTVIIPHDEQAKKWRDLDDDRREQLKIGGGLLAGAATISAGYHAWNKNKKRTEEEKPALTWGLQKWLRDAYVRTEEFRNHGPRAPTTWVLVDGCDKIPQSAIEAGKDKNGHPIYIARAYYEDGIQIGKASPVFKEGAAISYGGRGIEFNKFEILIGDPHAVKWVWPGSRLNIQQRTSRSVVGGWERNGAPLYITRVRYDGGVHVAKAGEHISGAHLAFNGKEVIINGYELLCLKVNV